jgi:hypothetical protein
MVPEAGIEPARLAAGDFESPASTNFTTRADCEERDYDIFFSAFLKPNTSQAKLPNTAKSKIVPIKNKINIRLDLSLDLDGSGAPSPA